MARESEIPDALRAATSPEQIDTVSALRGLLITNEGSLARAFRRELTHVAESPLSLEEYGTHEEAVRKGRGPYQWVAVDLDGALAPSEAVRLAREAWSDAHIAVLSCWWSERDAVARDLADVVVHKPLRSPELLAFLRVLTLDSRQLRASEREQTITTFVS